MHKKHEASSLPKQRFRVHGGASAAYVMHISTRALQAMGTCPVINRVHPLQSEIATATLMTTLLQSSLQ